MVLRLSLAMVLAAQFGGDLRAQLDEYQVKAAFLQNFAKFIEWPAEAFSSPSEPFTICVLGQDPFGRSLDDAVAGKLIATHPIAARRIADARLTAGCQILYVSSSQQKHVFSILAAGKQTGILTVGEARDGTPEDVLINLTLEQGKVRFEINLRKANEEKLHISARLLSLATVVRK